MGGDLADPGAFLISRIILASAYTLLTLPGSLCHLTLLFDMEGFPQLLQLTLGACGQDFRLKLCVLPCPVFLRAWDQPV